MTDKSQTKTETSEVRELTEGIERTRSEMSSTLTQLEHRLSPAELGEQARLQLDHIETRAKALIKEGLDEAKGALDERIVAAKDAVKEELKDAKDMVTHGLSEARESVKKDIEAAIGTTKKAVREATIGRVENLATQAGDVMNDTRDTLVETIRQNPIPAALAGIGLAWLLMNRSSSHRRQRDGWGSPDGGRAPGHDGDGRTRAARDEGGMSHAAGQVAHRAGEVVHQVGAAIGTAGSAVSGAARTAAHSVEGALGQGVDAAGHLAHQAHDLAGSVAHSASDQAWRAEHGVEAALRSHPLAMGAVAVAVGAAVGYALPRTHKEDELMGGIRDHLLHSATDLAGDATHSLQRMATDAGDTAKKALVAAASK
jgi:hypothetical protein